MHYVTVEHKHNNKLVYTDDILGGNMTINLTKSRIYKLLHFVLLIAILGLLVYNQVNDSTSDATRKITVTGEATIEAEPDEYTFSPYFEAKGTDRDVLKEQVTAQANAAIEKLKELGVEEKDIRLDMSSYDRWYWRAGEEGTLVAHLEVTSNDKERAQRIQDYLLTLDIKGMISPNATFSEARSKEIDAQVTELAIDDAKAKAELQAKKFEAKIGKVVEVNQAQESAIPYYGRVSAEGVASDTANQSSVPVLPGQNEYRQTVTVTYELE